jgi:outer membrane protein TolC
MKKQFLFLILASAIQLNSTAQNLTVEACQEKATANYPLIKQYGLIEKTAKFNISNANKGFLPQLTFSAKATYQSAVTQIPASLGTVLSGLTHQPFSFPALPRDQYQAVLEATQVLWDGGVISSQKRITNASTDLEKQSLDVDLFALKDRVNQLFFGILLLSDQLKQNDILKNDLQTNYDLFVAYKKNGVANQSDLDAIKVEQINAIQHESDLKSSRNSYCMMLSALTGLKVTDQSELTKPESDFTALNDSTNHRPELRLFDAQTRLYENQKSLLTAGNLPKLSAFVQGGYGQPGLNMFTTGFSPFYVGGLRLSWNISGFYTQKNNINKLELSKKTVEVQRETFLFNNNLATKQQKNDIEKLQSTLSNDIEIIRLRQNIKKATTAKVENGTATESDLIREINAENQARQLKSLHEIQLLMTVYQLKNNINN